MDEVSGDGSTEMLAGRLAAAPSCKPQPAKVKAHPTRSRPWNLVFSCPAGRATTDGGGLSSDPTQPKELTGGQALRIDPSTVAKWSKPTSVSISR